MAIGVPLGAPTRLFEIDVQTEPPADLLRRILANTKTAGPPPAASVTAQCSNRPSQNPNLRPPRKRPNPTTAAAKGCGWRRAGSASPCRTG